MHSAVLSMRVLFAIAVALLVAAAVQVSIGSGLGFALYSAGDVALGRGGEFGGWLAKVPMTAFMAAAFVWALPVLVPRHLRRPVVTVAVMIVGLKFTMLIAVALAHRPSEPWWLAQGLAGWLGAAPSYAMACRARWGTATAE